MPESFTVSSPAPLTEVQRTTDDVDQVTWRFLVQDGLPNQDASQSLLKALQGPIARPGSSASSQKPRNARAAKLLPKASEVEPAASRLPTCDGCKHNLEGPITQIQWYWVSNIMPVMAFGTLCHHTFGRFDPQGSTPDTVLVCFSVVSSRPWLHPQLTSDDFRRCAVRVVVAATDAHSFCSVWHANSNGIPRFLFNALGRSCFKQN